MKPDEVSYNVRSVLSLSDVHFVANVMKDFKSDKSGRFFWACIERWKDDSDGDLTDTIFQNLQLIKGSEVFVLFKLIKPGMVRINFRSRGDFDVNVIAKIFDGGGHAKAAGATVEGMGLKQVQEQVVNRIIEDL